jgi:LL-diaminopimelate aminotransferase
VEITPSTRLGSIGSYAFAEVDRKVAELKAKGITPTDFGVGDPTVPTPEYIRKAVKQAVDSRASAGYPPYEGLAEFRKACAEWMERRFGVALDPGIEITSTIGSKEAVFNFAEAFVNPGDYVIIPSPGYPPYERGTVFAEGEPFFLPILKENGFLPDLGAVPPEILEKAVIMWINYPNSPTGTIAPPDFFETVTAFCRDNGIILASDEAYTELYYTDEKPRSALEFSSEGVVSFFSLSKRSAMTCYRVGWVAGDERIISAFRKVKTNIDSGTPSFIQDGAAAALEDEEHVVQFRKEYRQKRDILIDALTSCGLSDCTPDGTIYIWQEVPEGMTDVEFATRLVEEDIAVVTTPGSWITREINGSNPGSRYVRFALVPSVEETEQAARRIQKALGTA